MRWKKTSEKNSGINRRSKLKGLIGSHGAENGRFTQRLSVVGRRSFLKRISAFGGGAGVLSYATADELVKITSGSTDRLSYVSSYELDDKGVPRSRDGRRSANLEAKFATIARDKWASIESAHRVSEQLYKQLQAKFGDPTINAGVLSDGGEGVTVLVARKTSKGISGSELPITNRQIRELLPDTAKATLGSGTNTITVDGIPVKFREWTVSQLDHDPSSLENGHFSEKYRPLPGGCEIRAHDPYNGQTQVGTTAQPVWNTVSEEYETLTAGHLLVSDLYDYTEVYQPDDSDDGGLAGYRSAYEEDGTEKLNDIDGDGEADKYVITDIDGGTFSSDSTDVKYALATEDGGYGDDIVGYWTWDEIKYKEDTGGLLTKQGRTTDYESGEIFYTDSNKYWFATYAYGKSGDSGGPYYASDGPGDVKTAGVVSTGIDLSNDGDNDGTGGNALGHILDTLGLTWI